MSITIIINSDKPLPENMQEIVDDIGSTFVYLLPEGGVETPEEAELVFQALFDYAETKGYDLDIVTQIISQAMNQFEGEADGD